MLTTKVEKKKTCGQRTNYNVWVHIPWRERVIEGLNRRKVGERGTNLQPSKRKIDETKRKTDKPLKDEQTN
jgi:hypothetical protein